MTAKHTSPRKAAASRANGAKSRGPKTPAGKARSSQNSVIHGLLRTSIVLTEESQDLFDLFQSEIVDEFQPATPFESMLVNLMASARWRSFRAAGLECSGINFAVKANPQTALDPSTRTALAVQSQEGDGRGGVFLRYEAHFERIYFRAYRALIQFRQLSGTIFHPSPSEDNSPAPEPPPAQPITTPITKPANWHKNRLKNRAQRRREAAKSQLPNEPTRIPDPPTTGTP